MRFRTTILQSGVTATGIRIPPEIVEGTSARYREIYRILTGRSLA